MKDINNIIEETVKRTGQPEEVVEKVVRSMFQDIQIFMSKKHGYNIQIPQVGTFVFRANAIPNFIDRNKSTLAHWINRLLIGEVKGLEKTISAAKNNISSTFHNIERASFIKEQFINEHSKYKPNTRAYLQSNDDSDYKSISDYISLIKSQLFYEENDYPAPEDLP